MDRLHTLLDAHLAALTAAEPYFAPNFAAARCEIDKATLWSDGLHWRNGIVCGPLGCNCGNRGCLHPNCWRLFVGVR